MFLEKTFTSTAHALQAWWNGVLNAHILLTAPAGTWDNNCTHAYMVYFKKRGCVAGGGFKGNEYHERRKGKDPGGGLIESLY